MRLLLRQSINILILLNHKVLGWKQEDMNMKRFAASADSETDENIWETVEAAYVYTFPLVLMDATETSATNTEEAATEKAPVNQFIHSVALADAQFDTSVLTGDVAENWKTMLTEVRLKLIKEGQKFSKKLGQWDYFGEPIGDFNTEYAYRALVALARLGANTVEVALYPKIEQDADGNPLTGEKSYLLHFESYPQVLEGGFWSVTAYGDDDFLIDNPMDRYCINNRSGLKMNDDGSVDVILSEDAPEDTTNWLPVGDGFHLFMRIYTPDMDALETWTAPTITEIDPSNGNYSNPLK